MYGHIYTEEERQFMTEYVPGHTYREIQTAFIENFGWDITLSQVKSYIGRYKLNTGRTGKFEKGHISHGTLNEFELKVKGLVKTGEVDVEGNTIYDRVEPSVKEMNFLLPIMVREGCEIEGIELDMTDREMIRNSNVSYIDLNKIIVKEFDQCFKTRKKESPSK